MKNKTWSWMTRSPTIQEIPFLVKKTGAHYISDILTSMDITEITLNPNIVELGYKAFYQQDSLKLRFLPLPKLKIVGEYAFGQCTNSGFSLAGLPASIEELRPWCFYACYNMTMQDDFRLPLVTSIPEGAFSSCSNMNPESLPQNLTNIGDSAFYTCSKLAIQNLPSGIVSLGVSSFSGCVTLALTSLPEGLTTIPSYCFFWCSLLALTSLPPNITSLGSSCFHNCVKIALSSLPNALETIGDSAFRQCTLLTITHIPASVQTIGLDSFKSCTGLTSITFDGTPTSINATAFAFCPNLLTINVPWTEGAVANAPWGATSATINYNYVP